MKLSLKIQYIWIYMNCMIFNHLACFLFAFLLDLTQTIFLTKLRNPVTVYIVTKSHSYLLCPRSLIYHQRSNKGVDLQGTCSDNITLLALNAFLQEGRSLASPFPGLVGAHFPKANTKNGFPPDLFMVMVLSLPFNTFLMLW